MKERKLFLMSAVLMLVSGFCGCNSDSKSENESDSGILVRNIANTGCKSAETRGDGQDGEWPEYIELLLSAKHESQF